MISKKLIASIFPDFLPPELKERIFFFCSPITLANIADASTAEDRELAEAYAKRSLLKLGVSEQALPTKINWFMIYHQAYEAAQFLKKNGFVNGVNGHNNTKLPNFWSCVSFPETLPRFYSSLEFAATRRENKDVLEGLFLLGFNTNCLVSGNFSVEGYGIGDEAFYGCLRPAMHYCLSNGRVDKAFEIAELFIYNCRRDRSMVVYAKFEIIEALYKERQFDEAFRLIQERIPHKDRASIVQRLLFNHCSRNGFQDALQLAVSTQDTYEWMKAPYNWMHRLRRIDAYCKKQKFRDAWYIANDLYESAMLSAHNYIKKLARECGRAVF